MKVKNGNLIHATNDSWPIVAFACDKKARI